MVTTPLWKYPQYARMRNPGGVDGRWEHDPIHYDQIAGIPDLAADVDFRSLFRTFMEDNDWYYIDFNANITSANTLERGWQYALSGAGAFTIVDAINGIAELQGAASGSGGAYAYVDLGAGTIGCQDAARDPEFYCRWAMQTEAGTERTYIGLCNGWAFGIPVTLPAGFYFDHVPGANIQAITSAGGGSETAIDTGLNPVTGTFYRFRIVVRGGGLSVDYYIDGSKVASNALTMPASGTRLQPGARHDRTSGAPITGTSRVDYIFGWDTRTP